MNDLKQQIEEIFKLHDAYPFIKTLQEKVLGLLADYDIHPKGKYDRLKSILEMYKHRHICIPRHLLHKILAQFDGKTASKLKKLLGMKEISEYVCIPKNKLEDAFDDGIAELEDQKYNVMPPNVSPDYAVSEEDVRTLLMNIKKGVLEESK